MRRRSRKIYAFCLSHPITRSSALISGNVFPISAMSCDDVDLGDPIPRQCRNRECCFFKIKWLAMEYVILSALAVIGGWLGAYFGAYTKKKGENLATHEDIDKLVAQMAAVTKATKEIESRISNDVWDRQKQWELRREILFEAAKRLSEVDGALLSLQTFWKARKSADMNEQSWISLQHQYITGWHIAIKSFEECETLVQVTCSRATTGQAFAELSDLLRETAAKITQDDVAFYDQTKLDRQRKFTMAKVAIRKELGIALEITPQSSESSATQGPGPREP